MYKAIFILSLGIYAGQARAFCDSKKVVIECASQAQATKIRISFCDSAMDDKNSDPADIVLIRNHKPVVKYKAFNLQFWMDFPEPVGRLSSDHLKRQANDGEFVNIEGKLEINARLKSDEKEAEADVDVKLYLGQNSKPTYTFKTNECSESSNY
jgi:hypothetical protein